MIVRLAVGAAVMLAAGGYSATLAQSRSASDALLGRWDLVVQRGAQTTDPAEARGRSPKSNSPTARFASPSRLSGKTTRATSPSRGGSRAIASPAR